MDENHQDKAGSNITANENKLWYPPLSPQAQKKLNRLHKKPFAERMFLGKTLWDWIQLALQIVGALAVLLTLISLIINVQQFKEQQRSENDRTIQQQKDEKSRAIDQQQQTTLESYLDHMSDLLLTNKLIDSKVGDEVRSVARARTLTALQDLNSIRKGILLHFLYESRLIQSPGPTDKVKNPIIDLTNADLSNVELHLANLSGADLQGANLNYAILEGADLRGANLSYTRLLGADLSPDYPGGPTVAVTDLTNADLTHAYLRAANLSFTELSGSDLRNVTLTNSTLSYADLRRADLSRSGLNYADLSGADLNDANLSYASLVNANFGSDANYNGASLHNTDLHNANLFDAHVTTKQLAVAKSLEGATMPDRSKHP